MKSVFVSVPLTKHYQGKHDQSTHGSWADGADSGTLWHGEVQDYTQWTAWKNSLAGKSGLGGATNDINVKIENEAKKLKFPQEEIADTGRFNGDKYNLREMWKLSILKSYTDTMKRNQEWRRNEQDFTDSESDNDIEYLRTDGKVCIAIDEASFSRALAQGQFRNQFETNTSNGRLSRITRMVAELRGQQIPLTVNNQQRPIYGYVAENLDESIATTSVQQYGGIRVVLKDSVKERTTMTIGDSLNTGAHPLRMTGKATSRDRFNSFGKFGTEDPPLRGMDYTDFNAMTLSEYDTDVYAESQIFGGIKTSDIEKIVWAGEDAFPSHLKNKLKELNIPLVWGD